MIRNAFVRSWFALISFIVITACGSSSNSNLQLSRAMMTYWANFARTGDPNTVDTALPLWHAWSNEPGAPKRMILDTDETQEGTR
jgi:carboxylesterase type B